MIVIYFGPKIQVQYRFWFMMKKSFPNKDVFAGKSIESLGLNEKPQGLVLFIGVERGRREREHISQCLFFRFPL